MALKLENQVSLEFRIKKDRGKDACVTTMYLKYV